ncbi:unnamed protein product, partial [marine sediment metagenome]
MYAPPDCCQGNAKAVWGHAIGRAAFEKRTAVGVVFAP